MKTNFPLAHTKKLAFDMYKTMEVLRYARPWLYIQEHFPETHFLYIF